jgi:hypothetical protein
MDDDALIPSCDDLEKSLKQAAPFAALSARKMKPGTRYKAEEWGSRAVKNIAGGLDKVQELIRIQSYTGQYIDNNEMFETGNRLIAAMSVGKTSAFTQFNPMAR